MKLDEARKVADAVLFEGYVLYPYRATARKNQLRWQFGVLVPRAFSESTNEDAWWLEAQCLVAPSAAPLLHGTLRFLQLQRRRVELADDGGFRSVEQVVVQGSPVVPWDEGVVREIALAQALGTVRPGEEVTVPFSIPDGQEITPLDDGGVSVGQIVRRRWALSGVVRIAVEPLQAERPLLRVRLRIENLTAPASVEGGRDRALCQALLGTHLLLSIEEGAFVSLLDPPEWARAAASLCSSTRTFPVLAGLEGRTDLVLAAPIILYDHPRVAPESPGDLFDATEIDEILSLRTLTLTEEEKRLARATDARAATIIDRVERMSPEVMSRLHGVFRESGTTSLPGGGGDVEAAPLSPRQPLPPGAGPIWIGCTAVDVGSRVRLHPGKRRTDAQDMFLEGMLATVEAVLRDVEDQTFLAVTLDDDPAADLHRWHGRFHYFHLDEVEPIAPGADVAGERGP